jgi:hypothetical protein
METVHFWIFVGNNITIHNEQKHAKTILLAFRSKLKTFMMCCMQGLLNPQEELGCSRTMKRSGLVESNTCMANALDSQT